MKYICIPHPFLLFSTSSAQGETPCVKELLLDITNNLTECIQNCIYPIEIIAWSNGSMPHNVVVAKCQNVHTYMITVGRLYVNQSSLPIGLVERKTIGGWLKRNWRNKLFI